MSYSWQHLGLFNINILIFISALIRAVFIPYIPRFCDVFYPTGQSLEASIVSALCAFGYCKPRIQRRMHVYMEKHKIKTKQDIKRKDIKTRVKRKKVKS